MPRLDFYNVNAGRDYPLVNQTTILLQRSAVPATRVPLSTGALLDAGFVLGPLAGAIPDEQVLLRQVLRTATALTFVFQTETASAEFRFERNATDPFGTTGYVDAYGADHETGTAFLVTGPLSALHAALAADTVWDAVDDYPVEPSVVQSLALNHVDSVNIGFVRQTPYQPPSECGSSSSAAPDEIIVTGTNMKGDVYFTHGYNSEIVLRADYNEIQLNGAPGYGDGEPCGEIDPEAPSSLVPQLDGVECRDVIATINGARPDSSGGILITSGSAGIEIIPYADQYRLVINFDFRSLDGVFCLEESP